MEKEEPTMYDAPLVEVVEVAVEQGFGQSNSGGGTEQMNPENWTI